MNRLLTITNIEELKQKLLQPKKKIPHNPLKIDRGLLKNHMENIIYPDFFSRLESDRFNDWDLIDFLEDRSLIDNIESYRKGDLLCYTDNALFYLFERGRFKCAHKLRGLSAKEIVNLSL